MKNSPEFKYKADAEKFKKEVPKAEQEIAMKIFEEENKEESKGKESENNIENKEKPELEAIPIFRSNDLYAEMFPEITPAFKKGEEPTFKKVLDAIIQHKNKTVILDRTCQWALKDFYDYHTKKFTVTLNDFPKEFELSELPIKSENKTRLDINKILKQKFNISINDILIDEKIDSATEHAFSSELVEELLSIAKQKNKDIRKIYILTENISDHVGDGLDKKAKDKVTDKLVSAIKKNFNIKPIIVETMDYSDIKVGDHIIVDRHHPLLRMNGEGITANQKKPCQFSVLPLATELNNNERYLENKKGKNLATILRKQFEKKKDNED